MAELKFGIKVLIVAVLLVMGMQVHVGTSSIEEHAQSWMKNSKITTYLQKVADGATLAIHNASKALIGLANRAMGENPAQQQASRLNLNFQRAPGAIVDHKLKSPPAVDGDEDQTFD